MILIPLTTKEVARRFAAHLKNDQIVSAVEQLYDEAVVIEEVSGRIRESKAFILESLRGFERNHLSHYTHVNGPLISGDHFALQMRIEVTNRPAGGGFVIEEMGVYTVKKGLIIRAKFY